MSRGRFVVFSVVLDAVLVNAGFVLAFLLRFQGSLPAFNFRAYLLLAPLLTVFYLGGAWAYGLYDPERADTPWAVVRGAVAAVTMGTIMTAAIAFFGGTRTASFARSTILIAWVFDLVLLTGWRLLFLRFGTVHWPEQRVLVVGTSATAVDLAHEVAERGRWGWTVAGLVHAEGEGAVAPATLGGFRVLGGVLDVARIAGEHRANRVIVVSPVALRELVESLVLADETDVRVDVVPELYEIFIGTVDAIVGDVPLMQITRATVPTYYAFMKRALDVLGALVLLILVSPFLLVAALAIVAADGLPVIFSQVRLGKGMRPFRIYKLRTMVKDAEGASGPVLACEADPRVTGVGRVLRRYRFDELPQLVNILKGDMSFVGPRPERPFFAEQYLAEAPAYRERFRIKPGVTGLAQVSGGYATTTERKLKYDLIYMYHQNLAMDAQIVAETLRVVLTGRGAR
ncbi:MAG: sugar transferase [Thermoleophilia bacterium]